MHYQVSGVVLSLITNFSARCGKNVLGIKKEITAITFVQLHVYMKSLENIFVNSCRNFSRWPELAVVADADHLPSSFAAESLLSNVFAIRSRNHTK